MSESPTATSNTPAVDAQSIATGWVIYSPNKAALDGGGGFWNNDLGWGAREDAHTYPADQIANMSMPMSPARDGRWLNLALLEQKTESQLCDALDAFCNVKNLPQWSADELLVGYDLQPHESRWLEQFIAQWDRVMGEGD